VGFVAHEALWKVAVDGGNPVPVCDTQPLVRGATWGPDDTIVFAPDPFAGLMRVSAAGGEPEVLTHRDGERGDASHRWPAFLPGGRAVVFNIYMGGSFENSNIAVYSLDSGETKILLETGLDPFYVGTGHLVYGSRNTLFAVSFDLENLEVSGSPVPVLDGIFVGSSGPGNLGAAISGDGVLLYEPVVESEYEIVLVDRTGNEEPLPASRRRGFTISGPRYSPDGRFLAIPYEHDLWLYDIARGVFSPIVRHEGGDMRPLWTPDGQTIIFTSDRSGSRDLYRIPTDGSAAEELLLSSPNWLLASSICGEGQTLLYAESDPAMRQDIWALPLTGNSEPQLLVRSEWAEGAAEFAPGCRWFAYTSDESGRFEVYARPFGRPARPVQISTSGGDEPAWGPDGREIFYREDEWLMAVPVTMEEDLQVGLPQPLFEASYVGYGDAIPRSYDVSPDGQRFAFLKAASAPPVSELVLVLNWLAELERLAPVQY
jgi:Tol biopolymer transport system component